MRLLPLFILMLLTGCLSQDPDLHVFDGKPLRVVFYPENLPGTSKTVFVWGRNDRGDRFARIHTEEKTTVDITNGNWTFYAISWAGENGVDSNGNGTTTDKLAGSISCYAVSRSMLGEGKRREILSFSPANCNHSDFADPATLTGTALAYSLGNVRVNFCESVGSITAGTDECTDDLTDTDRKEARGHGMSYRFSLLTYDKDSSGYTFFSNKVQSGCISGTPSTALTGLAANFNTQLPVGDGSSTPFYLRLETYPGSSSCDSSSHGVVSVDLPNGLNQNTSTAKRFAAAGEHKVFVKVTGDDICTGNALSQNFAGGDGSQSFPYLICSAKQLFNTITDTSSHFKLLADIDLNPYYKGYSGSQTLPSVFSSGYSCVDGGSNFIPIGMNSNCTALGTSRTGDFDGGGKTISNLRIRMSSVTAPDLTGFIARQGTGQLRRLKFNNAEITGRNEVGLLAGRFTTGLTLVRDIEVTGASVSSLGYNVGGLVGTNNSAAIQDVDASKMRVSGDSAVGGIVGSTAVAGVFKDIRLSGEVVATTSYVGGISGTINPTLGASIDGSRFEGYVSGYAYAGGLVGSGGKITLTKSYSQAAVRATRVGTSAVYVGGLIGNLSGTPNVATDTYFYGSISYNCFAGASCGVGNLFGNFTPANTTINSSYFSYPRITGLQTDDSQGVEIALAAFTNSASFTNFVSATGDIPRLSSELSTHPCRLNSARETIANQILLSRGTVLNPLLVCNADQINDMSLNPSLSYKLVNHVYGWYSVGINNDVFSGTIDGDGFGIIGMTVTGSSASALAWWDVLSGSISDLNFYAPIITQSGAGTGSLVANQLSGAISGVKVSGLSWGISGGGALVTQNDGTIQDVEVEGDMSSKSNTGGLVQNNTGTISDVKITLSMSSSFAVDKVAGVVVDNQTGGKINRAEVNVGITNNTASTNQSLVAVYNRAGAELKNVHLRSASLTALGSGAHAVTVINNGLISGIVNESNVYIKSTTAVPYVTPASDAQWEFNVSSSVATNTGTLDHLYYFNEARWIWTHIQRMGVYNGAFGMAPAVSGNDCIVDVVPSSVPRIQSVVAWNNFIAPAGATGRLYFTTSELASSTITVLQTQASRTGSYDTFLSHVPTNDCSGIVQNSNYYLTYVSQDRYVTPESTSTQTTWSAWQMALDTVAEVINKGDATDLSDLYDYEYKSLNGDASAVEPVWIFTPGTGIRLSGN